MIEDRKSNTFQVQVKTKDIAVWRDTTEWAERRSILHSVGTNSTLDGLRWTVCLFDITDTDLSAWRLTVSGDCQLVRIDPDLGSPA